MDACPKEKIGSLLLATDGSEFSEGAVREGIRLAKTCGSKVTALRVMEFNPELEALEPDFVEKMETEAGAYVKSVKERAEKEGVTCDTLIKRSESPYARIVDEASGLKADMIVMGRRGRTGLKRLLMGSVTARVVGHSPVNVLVVPRAAELKFKNILVATDGSRFSEAAALEAACIAKSCGSNLFALSVADAEAGEAEENAKKAKAIAEEYGAGAETVVERGRAYEVIAKTAKEKNADLIVVGSHGRTGIERLLMGGVTERVIGLSESAVLVVKTGK